MQSGFTKGGKMIAQRRIKGEITKNFALIVGMVLLMAFSPSAIRAADKGSARGAAQDLINPTRKLEPKAHSQDAVQIGCPTCKDEWFGRAGRSPRSAIKRA